jgi:hypothetical protein
MKALETWATAMALASGFALTGYKEPPAVLLATSIAINLALAPLTAVVAKRRGRSTTLWAILGLCFGVWALAISLLLLGTRAKGAENPNADDYPPTPHAA